MFVAYKLINYSILDVTEISIEYGLHRDRKYTESNTRRLPISVELVHKARYSYTDVDIVL